MLNREQGRVDKPIDYPGCPPVTRARKLPHVDLVEYDPAAHVGFIRDALRHLTQHWPHEGKEPTALIAHCLSAWMPDPTMLQVGQEVVGWAIAPGPQRLAYAYVNHPARQQGVMTAALLAMGFDVGAPIAIDVWSRAASRIVERGRWRLFPTVLG